MIHNSHIYHLKQCHNVNNRPSKELNMLHQIEKSAMVTNSAWAQTNAICAKTTTITTTKLLLFFICMTWIKMHQPSAAVVFGCLCVCVFVHFNIFRVRRKWKLHIKIYIFFRSLLHLPCRDAFSDGQQKSSGFASCLCNYFKWL